VSALARLASGRGRWLRRSWVVALLALLYALPWVHVPVLDTPGTDFVSVLFYPIALFVLCGIGLDLAVGRAGIVNFGFAGFVAIGAYTMAYLSVQYGIGYLEVLPLAAVAGGIAAFILGASTLRLRGDYLAIVTLAFGLIVQTVIRNTGPLGGTLGIPDIPHPSPILGLRFGTFDTGDYWVLILTIILVVIFVVRRLLDSRIGRAWAAIREDQDVAELMGVPLFRFKVWAFVIGGVIGAIAGATYAAQAVFVTADQFDVLLSVLLLAGVVVGGAGNLAGVIVGATLVAYLPERIRGFEDLRVLVFAAVLVVMMVARPQGLIPRRPRVTRRTVPESPGDVELPRDVPRAREQPAGGPFLELQSVTVRFGGVTALDQVSLVVQQGEIFGLVGPNGAGKTTVFNVITGIYRPIEGDIRLAGESLVGAKRHEIARAGVARTFQSIRVFEQITVLDNVLIGADAHHETGVGGALLRGSRFHLEERNGLEEAQDLLAFVGLGNQGSRVAGDLSGGDQRRLEIARAMATGATLLLLDEPAAGFDQDERRRLVELIRHIRDRGRTVVLIEHDMELVMGVCDRMAVLDFGHKIAEGLPGEIRESDRVIEAYLGAPVAP
jgi:branched-chain amino acid transport system permease protein